MTLKRYDPENWDCAKRRGLGRLGCTVVRDEASDEELGLQLSQERERERERCTDRGADHPDVNKALFDIHVHATYCTVFGLGIVVSEKRELSPIPGCQYHRGRYHWGFRLEALALWGAIVL